MCLVRRKKISNYNHLQTTPSALGAEGREFESLRPDHNKINDLANKTLNLLVYLNCPIRKESEYNSYTIRTKWSKTPSKSIKVSCKCLVIFLTKSPNTKNNPLIAVCLKSDFFIFLLVLVCDYAYIILINKRNWLGDYDA